jgi:hypothetical protein
VTIQAVVQSDTRTVEEKLGDAPDDVDEEKLEENQEREKHRLVWNLNRAKRAL